MGSRILDFPTASSHVPSVLLDTSVLIYYLEGIEPYNLLAKEIFQDVVDENIRGFLSVISITEFVAKPLITEHAIDVEDFKQFLGSLPIQVLELNYETAERAGKLRSQYPSVPTPDALIVATALENDCDVFVTNDKRLKKLEVYGVTIIVLKDFIQSH
ncbi:PIN domain-containing protein [Candidatus Poribacteria bacterium]|nr:PIN domain-containing protein [Candidatus Poribacteria bacterium]